MKIRIPSTAAGFIAFSLMEAICSTLRWQIHDKGGVLEKSPDHPLIWAFWHNRIFCVPSFYRRKMSHRPGTVLTSPSYDGDIIASTIRCFRAGAVRGSTNKRSTESFRECIRALRKGTELVITPDGPRGPRYEIQPGLARLSRATQLPVWPIRVEYDSYFELNSWDGFRIPKPFSKVTLTLGKPYQVPRDTQDLDAERAHITSLLGRDGK